MKRRSFLAGEKSAPLLAQTTRTRAPLDLPDFKPKSMLEVPATRVERARFPVIDVHCHLSWSKDDMNSYNAPPEELLPVMDRRNIRMMVNVTGGCGKAVKEAVGKYDRAHPGRFLTFTEPWWNRANEPDTPGCRRTLSPKRSGMARGD